MIVKYCPACPGRPYTRKQELDRCPTCGSTLASELLSDSALEGRPELAEAAGWQAFGDDEADLDFAWDSAAFSGQDGESCFGGADDDRGQTVTPPTMASDTPTAEWDIDDGIFGAPLQDLAPREQRALSGKPAFVTFASNSDEGRSSTDAQRDGTICGRVFSYSNTEIEGGNYRRLPFSKVADALFYGQRMDDLLHRFTVRAEDGASRANPYSDVMVNVHGVVAGGMRIADNETVEVSGRYRDGILMAKKIDVITGGGRTTVRFQRSVSAIVYAIIVAVIAAFAIYIGIEHGDVLAGNIVPFLTTWLICAVLLGGLYVGVLTKMGPLAQYFAVKHGKVPIVGVLLVSLLLALILLNSFGIGATVGSALEALAAAVIPIVVVGAVIVMIFKTLIHP